MMFYEISQTNKEHFFLTMRWFDNNEITSRGYLGFWQINMIIYCCRNKVSLTK